MNTIHSFLTLSLVVSAVVCHPSIACCAQDDNGGSDNPQLVVIGIVTDGAGQPVSDATAWLVFSDGASEPQVIAQTTDGQGRCRFPLTRVPARRVVLLAYRPGYAAGFAEQATFHPLISSRNVLPGETVELPVVLAPPQPLVVRVVDAQGRPASGVKLQLGSLSEDSGGALFFWSQGRLPDLDRVAAANGEVILDFLPPEGRVSVLLKSPEGSLQQFSLPREMTGDRVTLQCEPSVTVKVTLEGADPTQIVDRIVTVESRPQRSETVEADGLSGASRPFRSLARFRTDADGKATARVSTGTIRTTLLPLPGERVFAEPSQAIASNAGAEIDLAIGFQPGRRITGRVLAPDEEPVSGVTVSVVGAQAVSGADGRFEIWGPSAGSIYGSVVSVPEGWTRPYDSHLRVPAAAAEPQTAESDSDECAIPPIIVHRSATVRGTVVDENGDPVSSAHVVAAWVQQHDVQSYFTLKTDAALTTDAGHFTLHHVLPDVDVSITASGGSAAMRTPEAIHSSEPRDVQLKITPGGMVRVVGRLRGSDGQVITDGKIAIARAMLAPGGHEYGSRPVHFGSRDSFGVGEEGRFESPTKVPRYEKYSIAMSAPGYMTMETPYQFASAGGDVLDVGEVVLTKARSVTGIVRDSEGNAITGAVVSAYAAPQKSSRYDSGRTEAKTDAAGQFQLEQMHPHAAMAIVRADGYRLSGFPLIIDAASVGVTLIRSDESIPASLTVHPQDLNDAHRYQAARQLLRKMGADKSGSIYFHEEILSMLLRFDPELALDEVRRSNSPAVRATTLASLGELSDALAEAESISDGYRRAHARFAMLEHIQDETDVQDLLATTLLDAQSIREPDHRAVVIAGVAARFAERGDLEQAEQILRKELPQAQALGKSDWPGFARGNFAAQLARCDHQAALQMVSELDEEDQTRHYQNIAHVLASTKPEIAEQVVKGIDKHRYVDAPAVRVAFRMASTDLPRAIRLLDTIDNTQRPVERARGLGVIAYAIRNQDPLRSRELLAEAFEAVPRQSGNTGSRTDAIFCACMTLLQFCEEIDPENVTDYFWRTVSSYGGPDAGAWSPNQAEEENFDRRAQLALLLARYDVAPELSEQIMGPVFAYWQDQIGKDPSRFSDRKATFMAMAMADPERAVAWALGFNDELDQELRRRIPQPWQVIGNTLTKDRTAIGTSITREVYHRWVIDEYDF